MLMGGQMLMSFHLSDKRELYQKIMAPEKLRDFTGRLQLAAARYSITFSVTGTTGASQPAHRPLSHVLSRRGPTIQAAVLETLFKGHF